MKIRVEIDFHPEDEAFEHVATGTAEARAFWVRRLTQRAFPYLRSDEFSVKLLDEPSTAEPAIAVPDEAMRCDAMAFGPCVIAGHHHTRHRNAEGTTWGSAVETRHPFDDAQEGETTVDRPKAP